MSLKYCFVQRAGIMSVSKILRFKCRRMAIMCRHGYTHSYSEASRMSSSSPGTGQGTVAMTPSHAHTPAYTASSSILTFLHMEKEQKPYQCGLCCVMFSVNVELVTHVHRHSLTKPYQCGYCKVSYDSNPELIVHVQTHTVYRVHSSANAGFGLVSPAGQSVLLSAESLLTPGCGVLTELESGKDPNKAANCCTTTSGCPAVSPGHIYVEPGVTPLNNNVETLDNSASYRNEDNSAKTGVVDLTMHAEGELQLKLEAISDDETEMPETFAEINAKTEDIASCLVPSQVGVTHTFGLETGKVPVDKINADRPFRCDICGADFKLARYGEDHKRCCHDRKAFPDATLFKCVNCEAGFQNEHDLGTHVRYTHKGNPQVHETESKNQAQLTVTQGSGSELKTPLGESEKVTADSDKVIPDRRFYCDLCGADFKTTRYVKDHKKNIHEGKIFSDARPFQCTICKAGFKRQCDVSSHVMFAHKRPQYVRERNKRVQPLSESGEVIADTDKINPDRPFRCDLCGADFQFAEYVGKHKSRVHEKKIFSDDRPFQCTVCKAGFKRKCHLSTHVRCSHERKGQVSIQKADQNEKTHPFQCHICEDRFTKLCGLSTHQRVIHKEVLPKRVNSEELFQCEICGSKYKHARGLRFHEKFKHGSAISEVPTTTGMESHHQCPKCGTCFKSANKLNVHFCQPKECPVCKRKLKNKNAYRSHMNIHTRERQFTCEFCGRVFLRHIFLVYHQNSSHFNSKPYECNVCQKGFSSNICLAKHRRRHTEDKRYSCTQCDKKFYNPGNLQRHALTHTELRLHECTLCTKTYRSRSSLEYHLKHSHEI